MSWMQTTVSGGDSLETIGQGLSGSCQKSEKALCLDHFGRGKKSEVPDIRSKN